MTFVLRQREGNHEVWSFAPSRLCLAENMDIWKDNGQEVRRSGGQGEGFAKMSKLCLHSSRPYSPDSGKLDHWCF